jgi:hypothetical protein
MLKATFIQVIKDVIEKEDILANKKYCAQQDCIRFAAKAARVPKNRSRAAPFVRFFSTTFLGLLKLLRSFSIATPETSYTTFTLCEIVPKLF